MGAAPHWGQSLLRSCLAAHSFPPPPPHEGGFARLGLPQFRRDAYRPRFEVVVDAAKSRSVGVTRIGVTDVPSADSTSRGVAAGSQYGRADARRTVGCASGRSAFPRRATYVEVDPMTMMQHRQIRYIGLDVHKATISVAIAEGAGTPTSYGRVPNDPAAIRTLMTRLGDPQAALHVAYEAGPTGYALHRQLAKLGIECMVVAPSLIPKRPGDKVKTDRRDALKLARLLRSGDLTPVWVPDEAHEALRSLVRARADANADQWLAKHRLSKLLLRQGCWPPIGVRNWSQRYC